MFKFKLPDIGEGVTEGEVVKWLVKEGDHVHKDQDLVEVMTDKVNINIPSPVEGMVKTLSYKEGQVVKVGETLIEIEEEGQADKSVEEDKKETAKQEIHEGASQVSKVTDGERKMESSGNENKRILASPTIRRIARDRGIDMDSVTPTGPNGRVTLQDLDRAEREMNQKKEQPKVAAKPVEPPLPSFAKQEPTTIQQKPEPHVEERNKITQPAEPNGVVKPIVEPPRETPIQPSTTAEQDQILEMHGLRRTIFEKMTKAKQIMPHFMIAESVSISQLTKTMKEMREKGTKVSLTPFFVKALAVTLSEFPKFNALYDEQNRRYVMKHEINLGVAIDTPSGLTVAVVRDAVNKSVVQISSEIYELATKARENRMSLADVQGSTFTLSNVGSIGGLLSTPIINYPEVAILAVHRSTKGNGSFESGDEQTFLTLSCDHRLIDGADAARFITKVKEYLENPITFLIR